MRKLKVGDILRLKKRTDWLIDISPWDECGDVFIFEAGTIFEVIEFSNGFGRMWCPKHQNYVSNAISDELNDFRFDKISK